MTRQHVWLALLLAVVVSTQIAFTADVLRSLRGDYPSPPVGLGSPRPTIVYVQPAARGSGLRVGDQVISIGGRAIVGYRDYWRALHALKPGETTAATIRRS